MELMVVVMLVAILAVLATPSMSEARNDRIAFDYARQYQQILMHARTRAAGTGAAHLAIIGPGSNPPVSNRGFVRIYAALDGEPAPNGPAPVSSCKQMLNAADNQWKDVADNTINEASTTARFIDSVNLNRVGINVDMDVYATPFGNGLGMAGAPAAGDFIAICVTPSGVTYAGGGGSAAAAITAMRTAPPFTGTAGVTIQRHKGGAGAGIQRRIIITGGGSPRLRAD